MVRKFFHKKSKRMTCSRKYKIEKNVREHEKKLKKQKRNGKGPNSAKKLKKDPGIPNSFPFKEKILKEAEVRKQKAKEIQERQAAQRQSLKNSKRNLSSLVSDAEKRQVKFEKMVNLEDAPEPLSVSSSDGSLKAYYKEFRKVIEAADIILEVLDARDPIGSRCPQIEQSIIASACNKKLVLILNKIDLVPKENAEKWLKYLKNEFPCVPFKSSFQNQSGNLSQVRIRSFAMMNKELLQSKQCLGANLVMKLLGNYCRSTDMKTRITVGVVGFPNVGKSSIINSLKRNKVCNVGSLPGMTKNMQVINLDKHIQLLDSPGIIMSDMRRNPIEAALKNCARMTEIRDPRDVAEAILNRCSKEQLMQHFVLPDFKDGNELLSLLARKFGRMKKHGLPDINKAGQILLNDWTSGKIVYYTEPPQIYKASSYISTKIVENMSKPFDIDELTADEGSELKRLNPSGKVGDIVLNKNDFTDGIATIEDLDNIDEEEEEEVEEEDMEVGEAKDVQQIGETTARKVSFADDYSLAKWKGKRRDLGRGDEASNSQINKAMKKAYKKKQKHGKKITKETDELADKLLLDVHVDGDDWEDIESGDEGNNGANSNNETYSFTTDFEMK